MWRELEDLGVVEAELVAEGWARGMRLDHYLCRRFPKLSRARARLIIEKTLTLNDRRPSKPGVRLRPGDRIVIRRPLKEEPPAPTHVPVVADFGDLLVVDKPAGLPVHPAGSYYRKTVVHVLRRTVGPEVTMAHRLDRETSGALVVCRTKEVERAVKVLFRERRVHKAYLALVRGRIEEPGRIEMGLSLRPDSRIAVKMYPDASAPPAVTRYVPLAIWPGHTLLEVLPETGRQHQIRAHMDFFGHPIVGDKMYGVPDWVWFHFLEHGLTPAILELLEMPRQALHSWRIAFRHPLDGRDIFVEVGPPEDFRSFLAGLGEPSWSDGARAGALLQAGQQTLRAGLRSEEGR